MSDRPSNPTETIVPDEPQFTGGWSKPKTPGGWRAPETKRPKEQEKSSAAQGWKTPMLPQDLDVTPKEQGVWHLPRPEDTTFTADDVGEITTPPAEAAPRQAESARPEDLIPTEEETAAPVAAEAAPQPEAETENAPTAEDSSLLALEAEPKDANLLALEDTGKGLPAVEEDDDNAFSMSELMALASLVEQNPQSQIKPGEASITTGENAAVQNLMSPAERAQEQDAAGVGSATGAPDPASYAQEQLKKLGLAGNAPAGATGAAPAVAADASSDAASYAQEQLRKLGLAGSGAAAPAPAAASPAVPSAPAAVALTPEQQDLARKFRDTQEQVRALRTSFQAGQITRDQLQTQLRQLMILDENRVWWMMGLETDQWYKFDNSDWVVATPPVLGGPAQPQAQRGAPVTATGQYDPSQLLDSLPQSGQYSAAMQSDYTQPSEAYRTPTDMQGVQGLTGYNPPIPSQGTPIQDPDYTVVGQAGVNPLGSPGTPTVVGGRLTPDTVVNPRVNADPQYGDANYNYVAAPIATEEPLVGAPDYNLDQAASPTYDEIARKQRTQTLGTIIRLGLIAVALVLLAIAVGLGLVLKNYSDIAAQYQPQIAALANYKPQFQTVRVLDFKGSPIAELNSQQGGARTTISLDKISPFMIHAVVSSENERFFEDPGWDWISIGRAFVQNLGSGSVESGASTITQQIARQLILQDSSVTPQRKLQEIVIAAEIAKQYPKSEILRIYLNEIYFGNQSYGVEAASQFYFKHSAENLNLPESAMLVAIIPSPSNYNPVRQGDEPKQTADKRREDTFKQMELVIKRMQEVGCLTFSTGAQPFCITPDVVKQAAIQTGQLKAQAFDPRQVTFKYPHFVQLIQAQVERAFGPGEMYRRGFVIQTTLDPRIQDVADAALKAQIKGMINTGINAGAAMVTDPRSGAVRAMVGSPNFNDDANKGQINYALSFQQPGSSIKPVLYSAALEGVDSNGDGVVDKYLTPASILWDVQTTFPGTNPPYTPTNFDGQFRGPVAVRYALQNSYNIPAVKTMQFIGTEKFRDVATRMGLTFLDNAVFGLPTALGATEVRLYDMMGAFGTLANGGLRTPLYTIETIKDASGADVALPARTPAQQVLQPQIAFLMNNILSDDSARGNAFGINGPLTIQGLPTSGYIAAKTGTTNGARSLWTVGYSTNATVGVWLGASDNARPVFVQGGGYQNVAPMWNQIMVATLRTMPAPQPFPNPGGVVQAQICADTGTQPTENCTSLRTELFVQNQLPPPADQAFVQKVDIDTWTGLRANNFCPDNKITGSFVRIDDPSAVQWLNSPAGSAIATRLGLTATSLQNVPGASCDTNTDVPIARIISPSEGQTVSGVVQVTGAASARTFNRYQLEIAPPSSANTFQIVSGPTTTPQTSGSLGQWNTAGLPNGTYKLRLAMVATNGGYLYRTVTVNINNVIPPTAPPVIIPTSEPFIQPTLPGNFTPLPFENATSVPPPP
jgi:membrane peptidoglycan carboxypeptidase